LKTGGNSVNFHLGITWIQPKVMRTLTFLTFLCVCALSANGQSLKDILGKGDKLFAKKDYENALNTYLQAYTIAPEDAETNFKVGVSYLHCEKKSKGLQYLKKAYDTRREVDIDIEFHLGQAYQYNHQYKEAIEHFVNFKKKNKKLSDIADHKINECKIGDSLFQHPTYAEIQNFGNIVNSPFHEYSPLLTADASTLIFTSNRSTDLAKIKEGTNYEDIYITRRNGENWSEPERISEVLNHEFHDAASSLSPDGKTLFLYYEEGAGDIYISKLEADGWTAPVSLNKNINSPHHWETSACISADGKKLYFTSNRPGGYGELDIYVSQLDSKGQWGKAVNLGPTINTTLNEDSPFIHADGVTLYFSSDGHPSMGSNDIFKSEFKNGKWNKPENLGYPINSIDYDGFFMISPDKKTGFYSAMREDGVGNADIFMIKFLDPPPPPPKPEPEPTKPEVIVTEKEVVKKDTVEYSDPLLVLQKEMKVVTVLKGKVIDETSSLPLQATITLVNNENNQVITKITTKAGNGDFELIIPHGGNYGVATEADGYLFNSLNFDLPQFAEYQEIDTHILMVKAEVGSKVVLKNIFFDTGKSDIKSESLAELENIHQLLIANPYLKVQINGHTDNTGNVVLNRTLSLERAQAVVKYLIEKGIEGSRVSAKGFGSERPIVSNDDENEGRELNRRTEIEIIEAGQG
jgi:outer membrane protein OmpA-like peptidoglycan-associated protein/tetratricopeptide (TPR) repeat protein